MRRLSFHWNLLLIVALGVSLAWTNKRPQNFLMHRYAMKNMSMDGTKYYISMDITQAGLIKGLDYDCDYSYAICTFAADTQKMHADQTGAWFYISDVPESGKDYTGHFFLTNY